MVKIRSVVGGMNNSNNNSNKHRLSQGPKKVSPPSVPETTKNSRASVSSFTSYEDCVSAPPNRRLSDERSLSSQQFALRKQQKDSVINTLIHEADVIHRMDDQGIDLTMSPPGRDSPGHDSNASSLTFGSVSSSGGVGGCRNSTTSLDSGQASNSASNSRLSSVSIGSSSFRQSYHSSSSSSSDHDGICTFNVAEMYARNIPDHEILNAWLSDLHFEEYYDLFVSAGYDMNTISRMTPEDLTAIGIKKPNHRKRLKVEIAKLNIGDGLPDYIPDTIEEWLHCIRLSEYSQSLRSQGYKTVHDMSQITVEDLEDVGIYRLGHQKRFLLAIKRNKDILTGRRIAQCAPPQQEDRCSFSSFHPPQGHYRQAQPPPAPPPRYYHQPLYCPEVIRINPSPPPPAPSHPLPSDMPRPMPPLQMFHRTTFGTTPLRSYDDADIVRASDESVIIHSNHNGGGGTLPRPKGYVKPRPVAKIVAKTRDPIQPEGGDEVSLLKKGSNKPYGANSLCGSLESVKNIRQLRNGGGSYHSESETLPFANEHAGTIRIRSTSHASDVSSVNWQQQSAVVAAPKDETSHRMGSGHRTAGDVLNDIGSMLADLTDELDAMLHVDRDGATE